MYLLLIFTISFFSITHHAASIVSRSKTSPPPLLPNVVGPVTNLTISNRMIVPDGFLRSYAAFLLLVPSYLLLTPLQGFACWRHLPWTVNQGL
jgi:hypothetical protein